MRAQLTAAGLTSFALVAVCGIMLYANIEKMLTNQERVAHTIDVTEQLGGLGQALVDMETGVRGYAVGGDERFLEPYHFGLADFNGHFRAARDLVSDNPEQVARLDALLGLKTQWLADAVEADIESRKALDAGRINQATYEANFNRAVGKAGMDRMREILAKAVDVENSLMAVRSENYRQTVASSKMWSSVGLGVSLSLGAAIMALIVVRSNKRLSNVAAAVGNGSAQISSAAMQVGASSQSLAEGASEQASSLEETNAAMAELESMAKRNSQSAAAAKKRSEDARHQASIGEKTVDEMSKAMSEIHASASEVSRIVGTIEDIAFQTNILALNAAVEAARAGEAGAGFSVVAEEVRNLAQRSASAAKKTAEQIDSSISRTQRGVTISQELSASLKAILASSGEVDSLIAEIATASDEQRAGAEQINVSLRRVDQVTQQTASQAEENASASEELSAQSSALQEQIVALLEMAGQTSRGSDHRDTSHSRRGGDGFTNFARTAKGGSGDRLSAFTLN